MKKIYTNKLIFSAFSLLFLIVLMANSSGRGNVFGQAVTGAPGDSNVTCGSSGCHSAGAFSPSADLTITDLDGEEVTSFIPGETYDVSLTINASDNPDAYGFQMVALTENNSPATDWSEIGDNIQTVQIANREYIEHNSPSSSNEFNTKWIAPEPGSGEVTFYYSANAVNGNGNKNGDGSVNSSFTIPEATTSTTEFDAVQFSIYPNPASEMVTIAGKNGAYTYTIFDIMGQRIKTNTFTTQTNVDVSQLDQGVYFITLEQEGTISTSRLIVN